MISIDENALICDFAETYKIYDYRELKPEYASILAIGLRDNSRIKMKISGMKYPLDTLLIASANDRLSYLLWSKTKDGQKGRKKPKSVFDYLVNDHNKEEYITFNTVEEFKDYCEKLRRRNNG
nr:MAG TPA: protein of unknown function (DUF5361) [Bacteriophage sp.]